MASCLRGLRASVATVLVPVLWITLSLSGRRVSNGRARVLGLLHYLLDVLDGDLRRHERPIMPS